MKTKIFLLNPPYKELIIRDNFCCFTSKSGYLWPPVDFLYLSGILKEKDTEIKVCDAVAENKKWKEVFDLISKNKPDIIIVLTGTVSFKNDLANLRQLKIPADIYLMGNTPAFIPSYFLKKYPFIKGVIHNFYDPKIYDFLTKKNKNCQSISYKEKNEKIKFGKINYLPVSKEISLFKPPQYHLFPLLKYSTPFIKRKPMITAMTSFGCPFNCKFCVASALNYYPRPIKDLEKEFDVMKKAGIKEIFFEDSTFNTNENYTKSICNLMIKKKYNFSWSANVHSFNLNINLLTLMKKAGCHTLKIGIESGNQETLNLYAPSKRLEKIKEGIKRAKSLGLKTLGYFILGFPNENLQMAKNTIKEAIKIDPDFVSFSVLTPDYGTKLYQEAIEKKLIKNKIFSFDSSGKAILNNPFLSLKKQDQLIKEAYFHFYLRPKKILTFIFDFKNLWKYIKNGFFLIFKKII